MSSRCALVFHARFCSVKVVSLPSHPCDLFYQSFVCWIFAYRDPLSAFRECLKVSEHFVLITFLPFQKVLLVLLVAIMGLCNLQGTSPIPKYFASYMFQSSQVYSALEAGINRGNVCVSDSLFSFLGRHSLMY